jgi:two-component system, LytTR family, response regulator
VTTLRVVVADDEPLLRADLARLLAAIPGVTVVGEARHGLEALELVERERPDALFLDIQMPGLDGLGVVAELDPAAAPAVVFVTAYDAYAVQAFDAAAADYLLKPFDPSRLGRAVERVRARRGQDRAAALVQGAAALAARPPVGYLERIAARGVGRTALLDVASLRYIEAADNYVRLHADDGVHLSRRTMRDLEAALDPARFARIHRSVIVALARVRDLRALGDGDHELRLEDGTRLTLTRSYRDAFLARFGGAV